MLVDQSYLIILKAAPSSFSSPAPASVGIVLPPPLLFVFFFLLPVLLLLLPFSFLRPPVKRKPPSSPQSPRCHSTACRFHADRPPPTAGPPCLHHHPLLQAPGHRQGSLATTASTSPYPDRKKKCMDSGLEEEEQHQNPFLTNGRDVKLSCSHLVPRPQFRYEISVAHWNEDMRMGELVKMKGSSWTSIGVIRNGGKLYCTIEEILFLVEKGALHVLDGNGVVLSLKDIYKKVAEGKSGCSWECFVVYRHLKSLGYIVRRHGLPWALKSEKNCCSDTSQHSNSLFIKSDDNKKSDREMEGDVHIIELFENMQVNEQKLEFDVFLPNSKFKKASPGKPHFILSLISDKPPSRREVEELERMCNGVPLKFCNVDHGRVSFFSFERTELPVLP